MSSTGKFQIVLTTCPDLGTATRIARELVEHGLAACVNVLPGVQSIYSWKGTIETATECLLLAKAPRRHYQSVEDRIRALHPYELLNFRRYWRSRSRVAWPNT